MAADQRKSPEFLQRSDSPEKVTLPLKQKTLAYRPAIDGLRAIAVLAVFIFHLNRHWLPGGFVGVDIFFVISGYLITSIIFKELNADKFSLTGFYQRRVARIAPAFFLVGLVVLGATSLIYSPQEFAYAGSNFAAAAMSLANLKYMLQGNYFQVSHDAQPYLHYWSLSVEEQYYLFFPLLCLLLFKCVKKNQVLWLTGLAIASFAACVMVTRWKPLWAFYLLPTRAFELMAGCILAFIDWKKRPSESKFPYRQYVSLGSLLVIGLSFVLVHEGANFPGWLSLLPVLGAVGILIPVFGKRTISERMLSASPLVLVGRMSYSIYLWHWPVFSLVDYRLYMAAGPVRLALKVGLSFIAAALSYRLVEKPARTYLNHPQSKIIAYAFMAVAVAVCAPLGLAIRKANYVNAVIGEVAKGGLVFNSPHNKKSIVLMGESNGSMYGTVLKEICAELDYKLTVLSVSGGNPLPPNESADGKLWQYSLGVITNEKPDCLVFACRWDEKLQISGKDKLELAIKELRTFVGKLIILNQPPILPANASREAIRNGARPPFFEEKNTRASRLDANSFLAHFNNGNVAVVDIASHFENSHGELLFLDDRGRQLYHDEAHLSGYGAELIHAILRQAVEESESRLPQP